jgi:hypothetical protein
VFDACKQRGDPFGQALIASGLVSEAGLRVALQTEFVSHASARYDSRFVFTTVELLAGLGARGDLVGAAAARARLGSAATAHRDGFAFAVGKDGAPVVIAVQNCATRRVGELVEAALSAVDASATHHAHSTFAHGKRGERAVGWCEDERHYVVFCDSDTESRSLVAELEAPPQAEEHA